ncbi:hypothetical protein P43SY_006006 [Pythium insidiosum]|uniref:VHS domain-containing protein n=1 Tax=Pythium insidiosum TaxID=114742 RepID=A0AAD5LKZ2_PYTIN|nr:hypothetical protein P43SY_006006 [Pythium insidiosum]
MDAMESKMSEWRRRMPSKRALQTQLGQFVQQKSVAVLYTQSEQERIKSLNELIAKATCEFEKEEHWDRIMKVVDVMSNTSNKNVIKEGVRYLRLRLGDPSPRVALLALTLTEALVKNCNRFVHKEIAGEAFMSEMESVYKVHSCKRGHESMECEGRALELIQAWGEAFMDQKFEYPYFIYTYEKLRKKGVKFPKYNKDRAPIFTPPSRPSAASSSRASVSSSSSRTSSLNKLSSKEVYHVAVNVAEMFEDMIHEAERDSSSIADRGVIVELAAQALELVHRLQSVIESAAESDSEDLGKYLKVNDALHTALARYDDLKNGVQSGNNQNGHSKATSGAAVDNNDDDDDEFADFVRARVTGDSKPAAAVVVDNQTEDEDDPFASFVAQRASKTQQGAPEAKASEPAKDLIDLWDDEPIQPQPQSQQPATADPWGSVDLLVPSSAPALSAPAPTNPVQDDIWADCVPAPVSNQSSASSAPAPAAKNPFDFFDDFATKATISSAPAPTSSSFTAAANPFDFSMPAPMQPAHKAPAAPSQPTPLNPFDF